MKTKLLLACGLVVLTLYNAQAQQNNSSFPNIIFIMTDDQGWGDVGYNGSDIKTPHLDEMAANSLQFNRFYSASAVCSPTRGSVLTGRHPHRYGITFANVGFMKPQEVTLAEAVKTKGYATGHFGKWHLGTMNRFVIDSNRGGSNGSPDVYSPPWENGFDVGFSTESRIPTWDPMWTPSRAAGGVYENQVPGDSFGAYFWTGEGKIETQNLDGDASRIVMDRAIPFMETAVDNNQPFLAVIWLHTPHTPVVAGPAYKQIYNKYNENKQHYYGTLTAMDDQIGRIRKKLREMGVEDNTLLFFTSDNGPAGRGGGTAQHAGDRQQGSPGLFRGRKGSLYEGGIRVPSLLEWPAVINDNRQTNMPTVTSDYYPTIIDVLDLDIPNQPQPLDGISLLPLIKEGMQQRNSAIGFNIQDQRAWMNDRYKIYSSNEGNTIELYDLVNDPSEQYDLSTQMPEKAQKMKRELEEWLASLQRSADENDYSNSQ